MKIMQKTSNRFCFQTTEFLQLRYFQEMILGFNSSLFCQAWHELITAVTTRLNGCRAGLVRLRILA